MMYCDICKTNQECKKKLNVIDGNMHKISYNVSMISKRITVKLHIHACALLMHGVNFLFRRG